MRVLSLLFLLLCLVALTLLVHGDDASVASDMNELTGTDVDEKDDMLFAEVEEEMEADLATEKSLEATEVAGLDGDDDVLVEDESVGDSTDKHKKKSQSSLPKKNKETKQKNTKRKGKKHNKRDRNAKPQARKDRTKAKDKKQKSKEKKRDSKSHNDAASHQGKRSRHHQDDL
eukprot:GILK01002445.1.p1 GENE.GILK01002445.1~~GILK01002445.1.p1  ORF type:complete len:173 (-),score=52.75 GILK01002445.1:253-771(-)